jgi:hypothetical protein
MLRKLELQALRADLASVEALLSARTEDEDPIGFLQFSHRKSSLEDKIADLAAAEINTAEVALFFGGRPVMGSRGVNADFGAKAIEQFQNVITTRFATQGGSVGARGPVRQRERAHLMITDVVRGSFGFVLQESGLEQLVDSGLKNIVDDVVDILYRISTPDEEAFEAVTEQVDDRLLGSLRTFFKHLDDAGATLKIVEDEREFALQRDSIERARERTESLSITETDTSFHGRLYILPESRRFELHPSAGEVVRGPISPDCLRSLEDENGQIRPGIIGTERAVMVRTREAKALNRAPRKSFTLLRVDEQSTEG